MKKLHALLIFASLFLGTSVSFGAGDDFLDTPRIDVGGSSVKSSSKTKFNVSGFSGSLGYSVSLSIPKGRKGMTPFAGIVYSSQSGKGWPSRGWRVPVECIKRETKNGIPNYSSNTNFVYHSLGSKKDLILVDNENPNRLEYRAKIEGSFHRYFYHVNDKRWEIWEKSGGFRYLGTASTSREDFNNGVSVFAWCLDKVSDRNRNTIVYSYIKELGRLYPDNVVYTGNELTQDDGIYKIDYVMSDRNTHRHVSYRTGFKVTINKKRLDKIVFSVKDPSTGLFLERRSLEISYITLPNTNGEEIIGEIKEKGTKNGNQKEKPPIKFSYYGNSTSFSDSAPLVDWSGFPANIVSSFSRSYVHPSSDSKPGSFQLRALMDMNGDGLKDFVRVDRSTYPDPFCTSGACNFRWDPSTFRDNNGVFDWLVFFQNSNGTFSAPKLWSFGPTGPVTNSGCESCAIRYTTSTSTTSTTMEDTIDLDGDGRPDHVIFAKAGVSSALLPQWCRNNGAGFDSCVPIPGLPATSSFGMSTNFGNPPAFSVTGTGVSDLNGDGFIDFITVASGGWSVILGNLTGVSSSIVTWPEPASAVGVSPPPGNAPATCIAGIASMRCGEGSSPSTIVLRQDVVDINGDGLPDKVASNLAGDISVYYNNGSGFDSIPTHLTTMNSIGNTTSTVSTSLRRRTLQIIDFDGDGLPDIVRKLPGSTNVDVWFNQGSSGFSSTFTTFTLPNGSARYLSSSGPSTGSNGYKDIVTKEAFLDIDGDKKPDFLYSNSTGWYVHKAVYSPPYLLKEIDNGFGHKLKFTYKSSTRFNSSPSSPPSNSADKTEMSSIMHVVSSVTSTDKHSGVTGTSSVGTTNYSYQGAKYNASTKEFRGFSSVTMTDPYNTETLTKYAQGEYDQGMVVYQHVKKSSDTTPYYKVENQLATLTIYDFVKFTYNQFIVTTSLERGLGSPKQKSFHFEYDNNGNLLRKRRINSGWQNCIENKYNVIDSPTQYLVNLSETSKHSASGNGGPCTGVVERLTKYTYDSVGNTKEVQKCKNASCSNPSVTILDYDTRGMITKITDPRQKETNVVYDSFSHSYMFKKTNPLGHQFFYKHDYGLGVVIETRGPNATNLNDVENTGEVQKVEYDELGRLEKVYVSTFDGTNYVAQLATTWSYNFIASVPYIEKHVHKTLGSTTDIIKSRIYFNGRGHQLQVRTIHSLSGGVEKYSVLDKEYSSVGRLIRKGRPYLSDDISFTDHALSQPSTFYEYDGLGRIVKLIHPDQNFVTTEYLPWQRNVTDENGKVKEYHYNELGMLSQVVEKLGSTSYPTLYDYDKWGNLISITDSEGNLTTFSYDWLDRRTQRMSSASYSQYSVWDQEIYDYDDAGNLISKTDNRGYNTDYAYDDLGRPLEKIYQQGGSLPQLANVVYSYDDPNLPHALGKLARVDDNSGTTWMVYDARGRLIERTVSPVASGSSTYQLLFAYKDFGPRSMISYPTNGVPTIIKYDFDVAGRVEKVYRDQGTPQPAFAVYSYNADGTVNERTSENSNTYNYRVKAIYDIRGIQTEILGTDFSGNVNNAFLHLKYTHGNSGRIHTYSDELNGNSAMYGYDDLYRLVSMTNIDGKNSNVQFERYFGYSPNGNLISQNLVDKGHFKSYSYGGPLYMGGFHGPHAVTEMVDVWNNAYHFSFYYDENGNIKKKDNHLNGNSTEFQFDHENQLRNVTLRDGQGNPQRISLFNYNYEGNRVHKNVEFVGSVGGPVSKIYIDELLEHDIINNQRIIYVFANGKRIARIVDATTLIYHKDVRGSSKVVTNSQGQLVEERHYYPFGGEYNAPPISSIPMTRRFSDKEYDASTGLYYFKKRYYNPITSQWISSDKHLFNPDGKALLDPQVLNLNSYSRNDPINFIDPEGQVPVPLILAIGARLVPIVVPVIVRYGPAVSLMIRNRFLSKRVVQTGNMLRQVGAARITAISRKISDLSAKGFRHLRSKGVRSMAKTAKNAAKSGRFHGEKPLSLSNYPKPSGISKLKEAGESLHWPSGSDGNSMKGAKSLEESIKHLPSRIESIKSDGWTKDMIEDWIKGYEAYARYDEQNPTASLRVKYLKEVLKHYK